MANGKCNLYIENVSIANLKAHYCKIGEIVSIIRKKIGTHHNCTIAILSAHEVPGFNHHSIVPIGFHVFGWVIDTSGEVGSQGLTPSVGDPSSRIADGNTHTQGGVVVMQAVPRQRVVNPFGAGEVKRQDASPGTRGRADWIEGYGRSYPVWSSPMCAQCGQTILVVFTIYNQLGHCFPPSTSLTIIQWYTLESNATSTVYIKYYPASLNKICVD